MKQQSDIILLLAEAYKRLSEKSPKFFRVLGNFNLAMAIVAGIPSLLAYLDIIVVGKYWEIALRICTAAGAYGKIMNMMPVSKPVDLPFTEKKQVEQELKEAK